MLFSPTYIQSHLGPKELEMQLNSTVIVRNLFKTLRKILVFVCLVGKNFLFTNFYCSWIVWFLGMNIIGMNTRIYVNVISQGPQLDMPVKNHNLPKSFIKFF